MYTGTYATDPSNHVRVEILIGGETQPIYKRQDDDRYFVVGEPGMLFTFKVRNMTDHRLEILSAVDQMNIIRTRHNYIGELAQRETMTGKVLGARITWVCSRWQFEGDGGSPLKFQRSERSLTGQAGTRGVIGIAVYNEGISRPTQDQFIRPKSAPSVIAISYGIREELVAMGIIRHAEPDPFLVSASDDALLVPARL